MTAPMSASALAARLDALGPTWDTCRRLDDAANATAANVDAPRNRARSWVPVLALPPKEDR